MYIFTKFSVRPKNIKKDDPPCKTVMATALIVALLIFAFVQPITASNAAYNVVVTDNYVMSTGKCTCSLSDGSYRYQTRVFQNYDPSRHRYGILNYEVGKCSQNVEGMWYSTVTDVDYCLIHGKSHDNRGYYLRPYNGVAGGYVVENGYIVGKVSDTHGLNMAQNGCKSLSLYNNKKDKFVGMFTAFFISRQIGN